MTHLTMSQVSQFIDGTADYASQAQCTSHLAVCAQCRDEVEFQKKLAKSARQNMYRASSRFTVRVMANVVPQTRKKFSARILDNLANIFAMTLVLGIIAYAVSRTSGVQETQNDARISQTVKTALETYAKIKSVFQRETKQQVQKYVPQPSLHSQRLIIAIVITILSLVALDRFVLRHFIKVKT